MSAEQPTRRRRVLARYGAEERERLIREQAESGLTKKAFCEQRGINLGTFHGWSKRAALAAAKPTFAQVAVIPATKAAIQVFLHNGSRAGIHHQGKRALLNELNNAMRKWIRSHSRVRKKRGMNLEQRTAR